MDDDQAFLGSVGRGLRKEGFRVITAASRDDALAIVQDLGEPLDVVVMDIFLPDAWGASVAFELKQMCPGLQIVYVSGYAETDPMLREFNSPEILLLAKPFEIEELARAIRKSLEGGSASGKDPDAQQER